MKLASLTFALLAMAGWPAVAAQLSHDDVTRIVAQAATEAGRRHPRAIIAVTDREGFVLGVWDMQGRLPQPVPKFDLKPSLIRTYGLVAGAITRAGAAAYLSSNEQAFTSRTAGYITQQHFPVGVRDTPPGPLVGVGFSSLFFSDVNRMKRPVDRFDETLPFDPIDLRASTSAGSLRISTGVRGQMVPLSSLNDSPGGVPLYKNGQLVGGIGVTGDGGPTDLAPAAAILLRETQREVSTGFVGTTRRDLDEEIALAGQTGYRPSKDIIASNVLIAGIRIPYVQPHIDDVRDVDDVPPLDRLPGRALMEYPIQASPAPYPHPVVRLGGVEGELRGAVVRDPATGRDVIGCIDDPVQGRIGKAQRLTREEVESILGKAAHRASITRAGIRLPLGVSAKVFISVVNNPNKNCEAPMVLGTFRTGEATLFSWDVAVQKARTAVFFSNRQLAMSARSVGFLAQRYFPPGLDGRPPGPLFGFQEAVTLKRDPALAMRMRDTFGFPGNANLPNGLTIFPGGFPLYRDGRLIGAIGISGDGVDQDDIIGASGCEDFLPSARIRADRFSYRGARLPYAKFPRDPEK